MGVLLVVVATGRVSTAGGLPAETPEIGHFLGQSRLCSPFGLRVGADVGLAKSNAYARRFIVNQDHQSPVQLDDVRHLY
jgi:hypothetical protein